MQPLQVKGNGQSPTKGSRNQQSTAFGCDGSKGANVSRNLFATPRYHFWKRKVSIRRPNTAGRQSGFAFSITFATSCNAPVARSGNLAD